MNFKPFFYLLLIGIFFLFPCALGISADFSADPTSGTAPLTVQFKDISTGNPTGWVWYFGDESYSGHWTKMTGNAGWSARFDPGGVVLPDGSIVLIGGLDNNGNLLNDVWRSTDNGATWIQMTANAKFKPRIQSGKVVMPDGSIILMGGYWTENPSRTSNSMNDVWRSTDNGATWTQMTANAGWTPRYSFSSIVMPDNSILLMGGHAGSTVMNDVWRSTDNGVTWTQLTSDAKWMPREAFSSVAMPDGSIVLMGGRGDVLGHVVILRDVWQSTDNGATWALMTEKAEWTPRESFSSVGMPDGSIVLMGGDWYSDSSRTPHFLNDVWRSTDTGVTWTKITGSVSWTPRAGFSSVAMPDGSIVLMGGGQSLAFKNDVWRFNPVGSTIQNPTHIYTSAGKYSVTLKSYNKEASNTIAKTDFISVIGDTAGTNTIIIENHSTIITSPAKETPTNYNLFSIEGLWNISSLLLNNPLVWLVGLLASLISLYEYFKIRKKKDEKSP